MKHDKSFFWSFNLFLHFWVLVCAWLYDFDRENKIKSLKITVSKNPFSSFLQTSKGTTNFYVQNKWNFKVIFLPFFVKKWTKWPQQPKKVQNIATLTPFIFYSLSRDKIGLLKKSYYWKYAYFELQYLQVNCPMLCILSQFDLCTERLISLHSLAA